LVGFDISEYSNRKVCFFSNGEDFESGGKAILLVVLERAVVPKLPSSRDEDVNEVSSREPYR